MTDAGRRTTIRILTAAWLGVVAATYLVAARPPGHRGRDYVAVSLAASALALAVAYLARRSRDRAVVDELVLAGVVGRLVLVAAPAFTSNDAIRYLWDGATAIAGIDPYSYSPRGIAERLPDWTLPPDNAGYVTLYPPAALASFAFAASFGSSIGPWIWKGLVVAASVATVRVVRRTALAAGGSAGAIALIALSPLLVLEAGVGAHVDALAALAVVLGLEAWLRERPGAAAAFIALGGLFKLTPALALVPLFFAARRSARPAMVAAGTAVIAGGYGALIALGMRPLGSLRAFLSDWRFGSPIFSALERTFGTGRAFPIATAMALLLVLLSVVVAVRRDAVVGALVAWVAPLVASPVVFPWYLVASAPVISLRPSIAWLAWATTLPLTYEVLDRFDRGGGFTSSATPLLLITLSVTAGLAVDAARAFGQDRNGEP